jgi:hypothetical protein
MALEREIADALRRRPTDDRPADLKYRKRIEGTKKQNGRSHPLIGPEGSRLMASTTLAMSSKAFCFGGISSTATAAI